ncbi:BTB/POZ domain-containing protein [Senna tora]|uniref:BTB/POZ domain-containing protein n=1 Tax=Senna tora TaxID=362788 RepID=A0A834SI36_9FABA|nr:BTB/POZ domain-containing protein [Senna tora]
MGADLRSIIAETACLPRNFDRVRIQHRWRVLIQDNVGRMSSMKLKPTAKTLGPSTQKNPVFMELYGRNPTRNGSQPGYQSEWRPATGDTGLEESMWHLALSSSESYPERPGVPNCVYYMRTGFCGYGSRCRYNHPRDRAAVAAAVRVTGEYPERVGEPPCQGEKECSYYLKTGQCKFGITCKFHHPQPAGTSMPASAPQFYQQVQSPTVPLPEQFGGASTSLRVGVARPPMMPGSYVQGAYGPVLLSPGVVPFPGWSPYSAPVSPVLSPSAQPAVGATSLYGVTQMSSSTSAFARPYAPLLSSVGYSGSSQKEQLFPERPGEPECQYYLRTGDCKYGLACRFHHPRDRTATRPLLSPIGLPLRPGVQPCAFYLQNGHCKFGSTCKFDHPMGSMRFSPSASSLIDMPVSPYPVGSLLSTLAPSTASSELRPEHTSASKKESFSTRMPSAGNNSSTSASLIFSQAGSVSPSDVQLSTQTSAPLSSSRSTRQSGEIRGPISDVSSDLAIEVGSSSFALHKFPLVSRCGRIRKLLLEVKDSKVARISLSAVPGGAEAFELAAKFCYGINVEFILSNIAMLRCLAHFLEMTEEFAEKNLESHVEAYLKDTVLPDIPSTITVLHCCETLLPISEDINLVSRLINAIANNACKEQLTSGLLKLDHNFPSKTMSNLEPETPSDWWGNSLNVLGLNFFRRVVSAVKSKGLNQDMISKILISYAHNSLQGIVVRDSQGIKGSSVDLELQKKQRVIVEAIVSLLPTQSRKSPVPMAFLSSLLKAAIESSASTSTRSDLERRIGLQLDQAILEDILIPANSHQNTNTSIYDIDSILRIFSIFLNLDEDDNEDSSDLRDENEMVYDFDSPGSPKQSSIIKVSKLLDNFLSEIALDPNMLPSKFTALAELLPDHARIVSDGLYRAVDIFLKVHPNMKESERYRLCKSIDCQKLSEEACRHAAQNERLPVQMAVQVLYFEQIRLRNAMSGGGQNQLLFGGLNGQFPQRSGSGAGSGAISPRDNYASVRRENRELKLEVARMRMRLTDLEKDHVHMKQEFVRSNPANRLFKSFTNKLSKLNSLFRINSIKPIRGSESRFPFPRRRRHSVS